MGGIFIGVPFRGTSVANLALMYASVASLWGEQYYRALLEDMKETDAENAALNELRDELRRVEMDLYPKLEFRCIYETEATDFGELFKQLLHMPGFLSKLIKVRTSRSYIYKC